MIVFLATVWKQFILCYRNVVCPVCLSICLSVLCYLSVNNVGVLWPNSWMDQDETWHGDRPRPGNIVLGVDSAPTLQNGHIPPFLVHVCCRLMAGWIKVPLGAEVGLGPGNIVVDGDPVVSPQKGVTAPPTPIFGPFLLCPNGWMHQGVTWYVCRPLTRPHCASSESISPKGHSPSQFSAHVYCGQTAGFIRLTLVTEVGLSLEDIVLDVDPASHPLKGTSPNFRPMSVVAKRLDGIRCHSVRR